MHSPNMNETFFAFKGHLLLTRQNIQHNHSQHTTRDSEWHANVILSPFRGGVQRGCSTSVTPHTQAPTSATHTKTRTHAPSRRTTIKAANKPARTQNQHGVNSRQQGLGTPAESKQTHANTVNTHTQQSIRPTALERLRVAAHTTAQRELLSRRRVHKAQRTLVTIILLASSPRARARAG